MVVSRILTATFPSRTGTPWAPCPPPKRDGRPRPRLSTPPPIPRRASPPPRSRHPLPPRRATLPFPRRPAAVARWDRSTTPPRLPPPT